MTQKDMLRYIYLVDRRITLLTSGVHWKPEYERELEDFDRELSGLRVLVDEEHGKRKKKAGNPESHQCRRFNYRCKEVVKINGIVAPNVEAIIIRKCLKQSAVAEIGCFEKMQVR